MITVLALCNSEQNKCTVGSDTTRRVVVNSTARTVAMGMSIVRWEGKVRIGITGIDVLLWTPTDDRSQKVWSWESAEGRCEAQTCGYLCSVG